MSRFNGELVCVDPYEPYDELLHSRECDMLMATLALMPWHGRVRILRTSSTEAARCFPWFMRDKLDFVYIDGNHNYNEVRQDIEAWWPLVTANGILAGHDYDHTHPGVMDAVHEFARDKDVVVRIVRGDDLPSWYAYKVEPQTLMRVYFEDCECPNIF
jgi:hypothetical protein